MIKNNNGFKFSIDKIENSAIEFSIKNQFSEQFRKELIYVSKAFGSFYNYSVSSKEKYDIESVLNLFASNLSMQAEAFGNGLCTSAGDFFVFVPYIQERISILKEANIMDSLSEKEELLKRKEKSLNNAAKEIENLHKKQLEKEKELEERERKLNNRNSLSSYSTYDSGFCGLGMNRGHC